VGAEALKGDLLDGLIGNRGFSKFRRVRFDHQGGFMNEISYFFLRFFG
jgi:hypothetical protein